MAYSFGGGINPQLGATDYSAVLRGAQNYAQSTAAGSAAIGQGIGSALASLGSAFQQYYDKKEKKDLEDQAYNAAAPIIKENSELRRMLKVPDNVDEKALRSVVKTFGAANILGLANQFESAQRESNAIKTAMAAGPSPLEQGLRQPGATFEGTMNLSSAPAPKGVAEIIRDYAAAGGKNFAGITEAAKAMNPEQKAQKPFKLMTMDQVTDLRNRGQDVKWMPDPSNPNRNDGVVAVTEGGSFAPPAQTNINVGGGGKMREVAFTELFKKKNDEMSSLIAAKPNIEAMDALLGAIDDKGQVITGKLAKLELGAKALINAAAGREVYQDVAATQEYIGYTVNLVGQIIKQFGAGTGLSDKDREFAERAAAGDITMDHSALKRLVGMAKKVTKAKGDVYNTSVKQAFGDDEDKYAYNALKIDPASFEFTGPIPSFASEQDAEASGYKGEAYIGGRKALVK